MGKIILTETQYKRFKSILIENVINQTLLNESDRYTLDTKKYTLKTNVYTTAYGDEDNIDVLGGITFIPTQKGNLTAQGEFEFKTSKVRKKATINFICSNNKFNIEGKYYDVSSSNFTLEGFKKLCEALKKNKKDFYGIQQTGGAVKGYTQQQSYTLKSKDGKEITIPKNTGYTGKKDQKGNDGATFKLGPVSFGWFGCKSKTFFIDKVLYKDEKGFLANNISKAVCGGTATKEEPKQDLGTLDQKSYSGGNTPNKSVQGGGGSSEYSEYV
jgi:hypothetical protein